MQHKQWLSEFNSTQLKHYTPLLIALLLGLAAMNVVSPATTGLDPSWQLVLSKAHNQDLVWGKDIIFTYGPYGYLFTGSLVDRNLLEIQFARYLLAVFWIYFSLDFLIKNTNFEIRLVGLFAFLLLPFAPSFENNPFTDSFDISIHEVQFTLLIVLLLLRLNSSDNLTEKQRQFYGYKYYFYGVLSSFLLLIKFSFGFFSVICFLVIIGCNSILNTSQKSSFQQRSSPVVFALLGICFGLLTFFSPIGHFPFLAFPVACFWGVALALIYKQSQFQNVRKIASLSSQQSIGRFIPLLFSLLLFLSIATLHPVIRSFLVGSWQISKGYNQSMSWLGDAAEQLMGTVLLIGIIILGIVTISQNRKHLGITLSLLILAFITFKHTFIRHTFAYAAMYYAPTIPAFIASLGSLVLQQSTQRKAFIRTLLLSFFAFSIFFFVEHYSIGPSAYTAFLSPNRLSDRFALFIRPQSSETDILQQGQDNLLLSKIESQEIFDRISQQPVDIQPWEVSIAEANQLNWHPAPIFQAYSAYTRWLDHKNLESYISNPPSNIIYNFKAIDDRHPYFDQPQTNLHIFCNYARVDLREPANIVSLGGAGSPGEIALLEKRKAPICNPHAALAVGEPVIANWNQAIDLDEIRKRDTQLNQPENSGSNDLLLVAIDLDYSLFGKFYNLILKTPPVYLSVTYENGRHKDFRLVIDNAKSKLMIDKLPRSSQYAFRDFDHQDPASTVHSIALTSPHQKVFTTQTKFNFFKLSKINSPVLRSTQSQTS